MNLTLAPKQNEDSKREKQDFKALDKSNHASAIPDHLKSTGHNSSIVNYDPRDQYNRNDHHSLAPLYGRNF